MKFYFIESICQSVAKKSCKKVDFLLVDVCSFCFLCQKKQFASRLSKRKFVYLSHLCFETIFASSMKRKFLQNKRMGYTCYSCHCFELMFFCWKWNSASRHSKKMSKCENNNIKMIILKLQVNILHNLTSTNISGYKW